METIALLRDISIVFLSLIAFVLLLVPGVILFFAQKYLRLGRRKLRLPLLTAELWAVRVEHVTLDVADRVAHAPISVNEAAARVQGTVQGWTRRARQS